MKDRPAKLRKLNKRRLGILLSLFSLGLIVACIGLEILPGKPALPVLVEAEAYSGTNFPNPLVVHPGASGGKYVNLDAAPDPPGGEYYVEFTNIPVQGDSSYRLRARCMINNRAYNDKVGWLRYGNRFYWRIDGGPWRLAQNLLPEHDFLAPDGQMTLITLGYPQLQAGAHTLRFAVRDRASGSNSFKWMLDSFELRPVSGTDNYGGSPTNIESDIMAKISSRLYDPMSYDVFPDHVETASAGITNPDNALQEDGNFAVIGVGDNELVLDFGTETVGTTAFHLRCSSGCTIETYYGESLGCCLNSTISNDPDPWSRVNNHGQPDGNQSYSFAAGTDMLFEPFLGRHSFRYVRLVFKNHTAPVELDSFLVRFSQTPVTYKGYFLCNDELLNEIWYRAAYCNRLSIEGFLYVAGPRFDDFMWFADSYVAAWAGYRVFGSLVEDVVPAVMRSNLKIMSDNRYPNGTVPPTTGRYFDYNPAMEVTEFGLMWVISVWEYVLETGDMAFASEMYPEVKAQMDYLATQEDEHGLVFVPPERWLPAMYWTMDLRKGEIGSTVMFYHYGLLAARKLAEFVGETGDAAAYEAKRYAVETKIQERFWDEGYGAYIDYRRPETGGEVISTNHESQANSLSILSNLASPAQANRILDNFKHDFWQTYGSETMDHRYRPGDPDYPYTPGWDPDLHIHNADIFPYTDIFQVRAHFLMDRDLDALELLRREWGSMFDPTRHETYSGLFFEWLNRDTGSPGHCNESEAHAFSGPGGTMMAGILGVNPTAPGYIRVALRPHLGDLMSAEGRVPVPGGGYVTVKLAAKTRTAGVTMSFELPPSVEGGTLAVPVRGYLTEDEIVVTINGSVYWEAGQFVDAGSPITSGRRDGDYIVFDFDGAPTFNIETPAPTGVETRMWGGYR